MSRDFWERSAPDGGALRAKKLSLEGARWSRPFRQPLNDLVQLVNKIVPVMHQFVRYVLVAEFQDGNLDAVRELQDERFFAEAFVSLTTSARRAARSAKTVRFRSAVERHLPAFLQASGFVRVEFNRPHQTANLEGRRLAAAYSANARTHFGRHLRATVNLLVGSKARRRQLLKELGDVPPKARQEALRARLYAPLQALKTALAENRACPADLPADFQRAWDDLAPVRNAFSPDRAMAKGTSYYDVKVAPECYLAPLLAMARVREQRALRGFQPCPMRRSFVPASITLDSFVAAYGVLGDTKQPTADAKTEVWQRLLPLGARVLRKTGLQFSGTVQTDGVSVTLLFDRPTRRKRGPPSTPQGPEATTQRRRGVDDDGTKRARQDTGAVAAPPRKVRKPPAAPYIEEMSRAELRGRRFKFFDPNRRDLLFGVGEASTAKHPDVWRYTANERAVHTRARKQRRALEARKTAAVRAAEARLADEVPYGWRSVDPQRVLDYARVWHREAAILKPHYAKRFYRKMRLYAYSNRQRADALLVNKLRAYADGATLVIGDWSRPNQRFHEPAPGVGLIRRLQKAGLDVWLVDEYLTSQFCPACQQRTLKPFRRVPNPRPWRRGKVLCHGLLRCSSNECRRRDGGMRLLNRDLVSALNMGAIVRGLQETGQRPPRFQRPQKTPPCAPAAAQRSVN